MPPCTTTEEGNVIKGGSRGEHWEHVAGNAGNTWFEEPKSVPSVCGQGAMAEVCFLHRQPKDSCYVPIRAGATMKFQRENVLLTFYFKMRSQT